MNKFAKLARCKTVQEHLRSSKIMQNMRKVLTYYVSSNLVYALQTTSFRLHAAEQPSEQVRRANYIRTV